MPIVKIKFQNSDYDYHATVSPKTARYDVEQYFVGAMFNVASYPLQNMQLCIAIEFENDS